MSNTLQKHRTKLDKTKQTKGQKRCLFSSYNCRVEMTLSICHSWLEGTLHCLFVVIWRLYVSRGNVAVGWRELESTATPE